MEKGVEPWGGVLAIEHVAGATKAALHPHGAFNLYCCLNDRSLPDLDTAPGEG